MNSDSSDNSFEPKVTQDQKSIHCVSLGQSRFARLLWRTAGLLLVALGIVGIAVPGLPTTVFMIMAAACFARSSQPFYNWVISNPLFGRAVRRYREGHGMTRKAKIIALSSMSFFVSLSVFAMWHLDRMALGWVIVILGTIGGAYILKQPTDRLESIT